MPGAVEPELFTRWVEFGAFSRSFARHDEESRVGAAYLGLFGAVTPSILRSTFQLRYAMQPYIYTEARRTYDTGVAFLRPLYYDWPQAEKLTRIETNISSATRCWWNPVVTPSDKQSGLATEKVWLAEG